MWSPVNELSSLRCGIYEFSSDKPKIIFKGYPVIYP